MSRLISLILIVSMLLTWRSEGGSISTRQTRARKRWTHRLRQMREVEATRPSKCTHGCRARGTCNEELGRCDCPRHLSGPDCNVESSDVLAACRSYGFSTIKTCFETGPASCLNGCNLRGKCTSGFCHCQPGFFGADCSLSLNSDGLPQLLEGQGYQPRMKPPKIYVYDLPPSLNSLHYNSVRLDRPLFYLFWQRLLSSGVRVSNGDDADYYFIPIKFRMGATDNRLAVEAVDYIRKHWPWWDRFGGGSRHILIHTGDMGRVESEAKVQSLLANATWLTHWGLTRKHEYAQWKESHRVGKDIVIPIFLQPGLVDGYGMRQTPLHPALQERSPERTQTFFFAGRICGDRKKPVPNVWPNCLIDKEENDGYSAGTRQKIFFHHGNRTSYQITTSTPTYAKDMARSVFCLAPTGGGHGKRNIIVSLAGCIPVTVTDNVMQPFEPEMDWSVFSLFVPESQIPQLHKILESVSKERINQLQAKLWCASQHLFWGSIYGGLVEDDGRYDAFETTMEILRMKSTYPQLKPEDYVKKDESFRKFLSCESVPRPEVPELCTNSKVPSKSYKCEQCRTRTATGKVFLMPGGAICCDEKELAKCPRLWE